MSTNVRGVNSVVVRCNSVNSAGTLKAVNAVPQFLYRKAELEIAVKRELTTPERMSVCLLAVG